MRRFDCVEWTIVVMIVGMLAAIGIPYIIPFFN